MRPTVPAYDGTFGVREAERLLWRAGFGPRPGQAERLAAMGLKAAVRSLTHPTGDARMDGPQPRIPGGRLDPDATWGHDHLWWLDRMVRSRSSLVERLTLVFHDWFATSRAGVGRGPLMRAQNQLFRKHCLGSFATMLRAVTEDPAMQVWLSAVGSRRDAVNENYARELMELFTLGAERGAYSEADVRGLARTMSGFSARYREGPGWIGFGFNRGGAWDPGAKSVFGRTGRFDYRDGCRLVLEHPLHASFFVGKLWSYFVPVPPSRQTRAALEALYVSSGHEIRPVVEAILTSPELYGGPLMIKPPVVYTAGLLRATGQGIDTDRWTWMNAQAGQQLFYPPDVSGWDDEHWLDTSSVAARWAVVNQAMEGRTIKPSGDYPSESASEAVAKARAFWNDPPLTTETLTVLKAWSADALAGKDDGYRRAQRQTALRMLVGVCPDNQVS